MFKQTFFLKVCFSYFFMICASLLLYNIEQSTFNYIALETQHTACIGFHIKGLTITTTSYISLLKIYETAFRSLVHISCRKSQI